MRTIVRMQFGSHVYGTSLPTSDTDIKAVHIPPVRDILLQRAKPVIVQKTKLDESAKNGPEDTDFESFSLHRYMGLLLEGQTVALDMLFTPERWIVDASDEWREIVLHRHAWLSSGVSSFVGYCRQQANRYGIRGSRIAATREALALLDDLMLTEDPLSKLKDHWGKVEAFAEGRDHVQILESTHSDGRAVKLLEVCNRKVQEHVTLKEARKVFQLIMGNYGHRALQAERNQGVDWKALMHAVRVCEEVKELLRYGYITFPRPEADYLLKVRQGELPYAEVAERIETGMAELEVAMSASFLRREPNHALADQLVAQIYGDEVRRP